MTARMTRVFSIFTWLLPLAVTVPEPRTLETMAPSVTSWVATSGRLRFMMVFEKKVSTSSTARKTIAAFLTHSLFFGVSFIAFSSGTAAVPRVYPLTLPEFAIPSTRYSSPCRNSSRDGII